MVSRWLFLTLGFTILILSSPAVASEPFCGSKWNQPYVAAEAWGEFRAYVEKNYAYLHRADAKSVLDQIEPIALNTKNNAELSEIIQPLPVVFRDSHFHISPSPKPVRAWIPSASDIWVKLIDNKFVIVDVKSESKTFKAGLRPGWIIETIDGTPIEAHINNIFQSIAVKPSAFQREYAANTILAGYLDQPRLVQFDVFGKSRVITLDPGYTSVATRPPGLMAVKQIRIDDRRNATVIRLNNSLGKNELINEFDKEIQKTSSSDAIILDLRDTPGGGNSTVARSIIGHFVNSETAYQRHENWYETAVYNVPRKWVEMVTPRRPFVEKPLLVLVGRWTGSMGEGLAIGLHAAGADHIIGTPMADLLGTLQRQSMEKSCLKVEFAWDRLFHVNGLPREDFQPTILLQSGELDKDGLDRSIEAARSWLKEP